MFNSNRITIIRKVITTTIKNSASTNRSRTINTNSFKSTRTNKKFNYQNGIIGLTTAAMVATVGVSTLALLEVKPEWKIEVIPTLNADAPPPIVEAGIYIDPLTKTPFPSKLKSDNSTLILVGTGYRSVSFLSIKVYCAAIYVDEKLMKDLSKVEGWRGFTSDKLLPPFPKPEGVIAGEALISKLLDTKGDFAVIITPLRSTTLPHLRDGFARAIVARLKQPHVASTFSPEAGEGHAASISELKGFFPNRPLAKGAPLYVHISGKDGSARFSVNSSSDPAKTEDLGILHDPPLARQLFLSYFGDAGAISEELRRSAAMGFEGEPR